MKYFTDGHLSTHATELFTPALTAFCCWVNS